MNEDFSQKHHEPIRLSEDEAISEGDARAFREGRAMRKAGIPLRREGGERGHVQRGWRFQDRYGSGNKPLPRKGGRA